MVVTPSSKLSAVHSWHVGLHVDVWLPTNRPTLLAPRLQVHTKAGPTIKAGKVVHATFMPCVANLAVVSRQVWELPHDVVISDSVSCSCPFATFYSLLKRASCLGCMIVL